MHQLTTQAFESAFQSLNQEQKEAVNQIDGPVLVFAGPGTGKTKVLTVRIGHILQQTDAGAGSILCLTFSNTGVQSMKNNLAQLLGAESEKIEVDTYHSFASKLINRGIGDELVRGHSILSDAQRFMILERLLSDATIATSYLSEKPKTTAVLSSLAEIFNDFKKQDIDNNLLNYFIDEEIEKVKNNPDNLRRNGELKKEAADLLYELEHFRGLGLIYDAYLAELEKKNKYEYEDLLDMAICRLMESPSLLSAIQEKYQYILVDEFQDTNTKQLKMLELLIAGIEQPNIFVVGDDDQCIYKFQGASNENLKRLFEILPDIKKISLKKNYRSTPDIIKLSHALISKNSGRPEEKKSPQHPAVDTPTPAPEVHAFANENNEAFFIASQIKNELTYGEHPKSIAVLFRKRSYAKDLKSWLEYFEIPYSWNSGKGNVLDEYWGKMLFLATRYLQLAETGAKEAETYLLHLCMLKYGNDRIAILYTHYRFEKINKESYFNWLKRTNTESDIISWINEKPVVKMNGKLSLEELTTVEIWLGLYELRADINVKPTIEAWDEFVKEYLETNSIGSWQVFCRLLNYHQHYGLVIEFETGTENKGVTLSTIHGSKGLEYHHVYVMGCSNHQWEKARHSGTKVSVPKPMYQYLNKSADEMDDLRRLVYVAFTRAKNKLTISYVQNGNKVISNMLEALFPEFNEGIIIHPEIDLLPYLQDTKILILSPEMEAAWKQAAEIFELTVSSLNTYLKEPEKFIWHSFFKIPDLPAEAMSFGSAVHLALERLIKEHKHRSISHTEILNQWEIVIKEFSHLFDLLHYKQYKAYGLKVISKYIETISESEQDVEYITEDFLHGVLGSVKISGKIDLIKINGDRISVIDYKTGSFQKYLKPFENFVSSGDAYWRQAAIYGELIRQNYKEKRVEKVEFHFVEQGRKVSAQVSETNEAWNAYLETIYNHIGNRKVFKYLEASYFSMK